MCKALIGVFVAATLAVPTLSFAAQARGVPQVNAAAQQNRRTIPSGPAGMDVGNSPGHVTGPGVTRIDNDVRAPINDIHPGRGTEDTAQSKNPKPVY